MATPQQYDPNIPLSTDKLSISQADLLLNYQAIQAWMEINHVTFSDINDAGKHKFVQITDKGAGDISTAANEMVQYVRTSTQTSQLELFVRRPSNGEVVAMTARGTGTNPTTDGWSFLPSKILLKWGKLTINAGVGQVDTSYNSFGPNYSGTPFMIQITNGPGIPTTFPATFFSGGFVGTDFRVIANGVAGVGGQSVQYFIIGLGT